MKNEKITMAFPPITENVYDRFNDDGWGIRDVKLTEQGKEAIEAVEKEERDNDKGRNSKEN